MNLQRAAQLVAISAGCNFLYGLAFLVLHLVRGQMPLDPITLLGRYCSIFAEALFFTILYAESSRRTGTQARATVALAAAVLMLIVTICSVWEAGSFISTCGAPNVHCNFSVPTAVARTILFGVLVSFAWAVLFMAFAEKIHGLRGGVIPRLAVLLAIIGMLGTILVVMAPGPHVTLHLIVQDAISICMAVAYFVFAVVLYRKWDSRKPFHDIIVGAAPNPD